MKKFVIFLMILVLLAGCSVNKSKNSNYSVSDMTEEDIKNSIEEIPDGAFVMPAEDIFTITGRGVAVTGKISNGTVKIGDEVEIVGKGRVLKTKVAGIEMFRNDSGIAKEGDSAGLIFEELSREDVERGDVVITPGIMSNHTEFKAAVSVKTIEQDGKMNSITSGGDYKFYFRTNETTGTIKLDDKELSGGQIGIATIKLDKAFGFNQGKGFVIRLDGKVIAYGKVLEIIK